MPKLIADRDVCAGYGNCVAAAPAIFDLGDDDIVIVLQDVITDDELESARDAVGSCPTGALALQDT